jgi:hypothetical protein
VCQPFMRIGDHEADAAARASPDCAETPSRTRALPTAPRPRPAPTARRRG